MPNHTVPAAAEGLPKITRREALRNIGAGAVAGAVAATGVHACTRLIGATDNLRYNAAKFTGEGWYAFGYPDGGPRRVMWAYRDGRSFYENAFIALSDGPGEPVALHISHRGFDQTCVGIVKAVRA